MPVTITRQPDVLARGEPDVKTIDARMPRMQRVEFATPARANDGMLTPAPSGGALRPLSGGEAGISDAIEMIRLYNSLVEATRPGGAIVQFAGVAEDAGGAELAYRAAWTGAAMLGKRVLFVDAWTGAGQAFSAPVIASSKCLRHVACGQATLEEAIVPAAEPGPHVAVLQDDDEAGLSVLPLVRSVLDALRPSFDMVVLAPAPALRQPLAAAMSSAIDGSVLVVAAGRSRAGATAQAAKLLGGGGGKVLGVVVNGQRDPLPAWLRRWL